MKKLFGIMEAVFIMSIGICAQAAPEAPIFNISGGIYETETEIRLQGEGSIFYTLDGSVPTESSVLYTRPITIKPGTSMPPKGTTIRAAVIENGESSKVVSNTYFVTTGVKEYLGTVPLVNLVAEPYDLWDSENGIYTNYEYEHKVPAVFHYITEDGQMDINRTVEIKVSGNGSRSGAKKSLRVYFKKTDPEQGKLLKYNLIPNANVDSYAKVTFRVTDWQSTNLRDVFAQEISEYTRNDTAKSEPMALFLNGEYWGLYECREQYDKDYIESHYKIDGDNIVFFDRDWTLPVEYTQYNGITYGDKLEYAEGPEDGNADGKLGESYYRQQWTYVKYLAQDADITLDEVYEEFCSLVDVDNYIDFAITYIFAGNDDWPGNNTKFWRVTQEDIDPDIYGADGKWRFMIHDFDISFNDVNHNTLYLSTKQKDDDTAARHPAYATDFLEGLLRNEDFRNEFAQRTLVYISTCWEKENLNSILDKLINERTDAKQADLTRWSLGSLNQWKNNLNGLYWYVFARPEKLKNQYKDFLNYYYNAGITGEVNVKAYSDCEYSVNGAVMPGNSSMVLFSGIPFSVSAEKCYISVTQKGETVTEYESLSFTPSKDCEIEIVKAEGIVWAEVKNGVLKAEVASDKGKLYVAGYNDDNTVKFVKSADVSATEIQVDKADYYRLFLWDNMKPVGDCYTID